MQINTKSFIKEISGKDVETLTVGEALANILIASKDGSKIKLYVLAQKFFNDNLVDLDDADLAMVKKSVENCEVYTNLVAGQLLVMLEESSKK